VDFAEAVPTRNCDERFGCRRAGNRKPFPARAARTGSEQLPTAREVALTPFSIGASTRVLVLAPGANPIDIQVTAADGIATRTYRVDVTREQDSGPCSIFCDGFEP
jgi:hypothetical protein